MTVIGMPGWEPANSRNNSQTVSAVMSGRFLTVNTSCVIAFKAASTFNRCRPEGALTKSRWTHQTIPKTGANTKWAASMKKTARVPDMASSNLGSRLFFKGLLGFHVSLGWDHAHCPRSHPQRLQKLSHLRRLAYNPCQFGDLGGGFGHRRGWMLLKIGCQRQPMLCQFALRPIMLNLFQRLDPACHIRAEITMEARFGNATQPYNVTIGHALTAQVEGFHPYLYPGVGM